MKFWATKPPGVSVIGNRPKQVKMNTCPETHRYVLYDDKDKEFRQGTLIMEPSFLSPFAETVENDWVQHTGAGYLGHHDLG